MSPDFGVRGLAPAFSTADSSAVGSSPRRVAALEFLHFGCGFAAPAPSQPLSRNTVRAYYDQVERPADPDIPEPRISGV